MLCEFQACRSLGCRGHGFVAVTLSQPEGAGGDYAHHITTDPPRFLDLPTALLFQERERMEKRRLELRSATGAMNQMPSPITFLN